MLQDKQQFVCRVQRDLISFAFSTVHESFAHTQQKRLFLVVINNKSVAFVQFVCPMPITVRRNSTDLPHNHCRPNDERCGNKCVYYLYMWWAHFGPPFKYIAARNNKTNNKSSEGKVHERRFATPSAVSKSIRNLVVRINTSWRPRHAFCSSLAPYAIHENFSTKSRTHVPGRAYACKRTTEKKWKINSMVCENRTVGSSSYNCYKINNNNLF